MNLKTTIRFIALCAFILVLAACAGGARTTEPAFSADSLTLDTAIGYAAAHFSQRLPAEARVALISFDTPSGRLSDYIFEEIWNHFEDTGKFVMVDRRNLERIDAEIRHQFGGMVDDNALVSIGRQYGAQILVHGQMSALGSEYRLTVYAIDVERAASSQRAFNVRPDHRLVSLLNVSAEDEVEHAVAAMARAVNQRTTIAIGRIAYTDTQTVSSLSSWLKNTIISGAQRQDRLQVASDMQSSDFAVASRGLTRVDMPAAGDTTIQAVVTGSFSPLDTGAEVMLQMISTSGNREVLSSTRFFISDSELQRRRLSLLPEVNNAVITRAQFETRQQWIEVYSGRNNRWNFSVTPDNLDGIFYDGDRMTMRIYSERDCYFVVTHVDVHGNLQVIFPYTPSDNNFIRAGETRRIPEGNVSFRLHAPFGEELILVAAYDRPFAPAQRSGQLSAETLTRGLSVEQGNNTARNPSATAMFSYTILPR